MVWRLPLGPGEGARHVSNEYGGEVEGSTSSMCE